MSHRLYVKPLIAVLTATVVTEKGWNAVGLFLPLCAFSVKVLGA